MLVLSRKQSEQILIGSSIQLTVVRISSSQVRLGIDAPPEVVILRKELGEAAHPAEGFVASGFQLHATETDYCIPARAILGDRVQVQYLALSMSGARTQYRTGRDVLKFTVGSKEVIPGISFGIVGMAEGEEKHLRLQPWEAYGRRHERLVKEIARELFPERLELRVGQRITARTPWGRRRMRVVALGEDTVTVDWNHPMAGEPLDVEVQLISLERGATNGGL